MPIKLNRIVGHENVLDSGDLRRYRERRFNDLKYCLPALNVTKAITTTEICYFIHDWPKSLSDTELAVLCAYADKKEIAKGGTVETFYSTDPSGPRMGDVKKFTLFV